MIHREHGKIVIECDSCSELFEGERDAEFAQVWAEAKRDGWKTKKVGTEWVHGCARHGV